jgi:pyruvate/2-oxoglutarate dehydrogenase complex dihydrolipoamide acyltransferase (E2) component
MIVIEPFPASRRHTLHFLRSVRSASPVYLDTEVDASTLVEHQRAAARRYSVVSYVLLAVGRTLAAYPAANLGYRGGLRPRLARHASVDAKLTLDKSGPADRSVLSLVLPGVDESTLDGIQDTVDRLRTSAPEDIPELRGTLVLQRLPMPLGRLAFALATRLRHRHRRLGTVAVTSLGHQPVIRFFSSGGTPITVGIGRIRDLPVARDGAVVVVPSLPLSITFDHRVLDGALAADVLAELKRTLEGPHVRSGAAQDTIAHPEYVHG